MYMYISIPYWSILNSNLWPACMKVPRHSPLYCTVPYYAMPCSSILYCIIPSVLYRTLPYYTTLYIVLCHTIPAFASTLSTNRLYLHVHVYVLSWFILTTAMNCAYIRMLARHSSFIGTNHVLRIVQISPTTFVFGLWRHVWIACSAHKNNTKDDGKYMNVHVSNGKRKREKFVRQASQQARRQVC